MYRKCRHEIEKYATNTTGNSKCTENVISAVKYYFLYCMSS